MAVHGRCRKWENQVVQYLYMYQVAQLLIRGLRIARTIGGGSPDRLPDSLYGIQSENCMDGPGPPTTLDCQSPYQIVQLYAYKYSEYNI